MNDISSDSAPSCRPKLSPPIEGPEPGSVEADVELAALAKALGNPQRLAILRILADRDSCMCGEIVSQLPLSQATVSQHLKVLKQAGIVQGQIDGPRVCYCINRAMVDRLQLLIGSLPSTNDLNSRKEMLVR